MYWKIRRRRFGICRNAMLGMLIAATLVLAMFSLSTAVASVEITIAYSVSVPNPLPFAIEPGFPSVIISLLPNISSTITITGPGGYSNVVSASGPGLSRHEMTLGNPGTYNVSEDHHMELTATALGISDMSTDGASDEWSFDSPTAGATSTLVVFSSVGDFSVIDTHRISVSISGMSATVTVIETVPECENNPDDCSASATMAVQWTVNTSMVTGTVEVVTNHVDATFNVTGPENRSDGGMLKQWTDMTPGEYTIAFGDVANHDTPASDTQTLAEGGVITFVGEYIPIPPVISSVGVSGSPAGSGSTIVVVMSGDPGRAATFSIGEIVADLRMTEDPSTPGSYTGAYVVQEGDNAVDAVVSMKMDGVAGTTAVNEDGRVTIDTTPPAIDSVGVSGSPARNAGDIIAVILKGEPGGTARFRIAAAMAQDISMSESTEQPGTYEGTYIAVEGLNMSGATVICSLRDGLGNTSVDESQTVSICTLPWDINKDGVVDIADIRAVSSNLGETGSPELDFNDDGIIDMLDLLIVAIHYGENCGIE